MTKPKKENAFHFDVCKRRAGIDAPCDCYDCKRWSGAPAPSAFAIPDLETTQALARRLGMAGDAPAMNSWGYPWGYDPSERMLPAAARRLLPNPTSTEAPTKGVEGSRLGKAGELTGLRPYASTPHNSQGSGWNWPEISLNGFRIHKTDISFRLTESHDSYQLRVVLLVEPVTQEISNMPRAPSVHPYGLIDVSLKNEWPCELLDAMSNKGRASFIRSAIRQTLIVALTHEVDEWLTIDGVRVTEPHPLQVIEREKK